jgi:hypothetical protein
LDCITPYVELLKVVSDSKPDSPREALETGIRESAPGGADGSAFARRREQA